MPDPDCTTIPSMTRHRPFQVGVFAFFFFYTWTFFFFLQMQKKKSKHNAGVVKTQDSDGLKVQRMQLPEQEEA